MRSLVINLNVYGIHFWAGCDIEEVEYLKFPHRHRFDFQLEIDVDGDDREIEFIQFKHQVLQYLKAYYWSTKYNLCDFGAQSCEMLAEEVGKQFKCFKVTVSEDGENGATWEIKR